MLFLFVLKKLIRYVYPVLISLSSGWVWLFWVSSWCQQHQAQTDLDHGDRPAEQVKWKLGAACRWEHICLSVFSPCSGLTTCPCFFFYLIHTFISSCQVFGGGSLPPPLSVSDDLAAAASGRTHSEDPTPPRDRTLFLPPPTEMRFWFQSPLRLTQGGSGSDLTAIVSSQGLMGKVQT